MIKKITLIAAFLFFSIQLYAQNDYVSCTIIRENGIRTKGFIQNLISTKTKRLEVYDDFKSWEKIFNLDRKNFIFKSVENTEPISIPADSLKSIIIYPEINDSLVYDKVFTKTINIKNNVVDLDKQLFLPLLRKGKLDFYGFYFTKYEGSSKSDEFMGYIKRPEDNFVIKPFDINRLNIFNVWTLEERIYTAFLTLTKDCDVYQAYMTDKIAKAKKNDKNYKKECKEELRKYMVENPDNSSDLNALTSHYVEYLLTIYIKQYENMCK